MILQAKAVLTILTTFLRHSTQMYGCLIGMEKVRRVNIVKTSTVQLFKTSFHELAKIIKLSGISVTGSRKIKEEECEELILQQRDKAGQDFSIPGIASHLKVSKSTACRIVKRQKLIFFKLFSTTQLSQVCYMRHAQWASNLLTKFSVHSLP